MTFSRRTRRQFLGTASGMCIGFTGCLGNGAGPNSTSSTSSYDGENSRDGLSVTAGGTSPELQWSVEVGERIHRTTVRGGTVYVTSQLDYIILAVDAVSGEQRWSAETNSSIGHDMVGQQSVFTNLTSSLHAFDLRDGSERWAWESESHLITNVEFLDGTVYIGDRDDVVYALEAATGNQVWSFSPEYPLGGTITAEDGLVFCSNSTSDMSAIDATTGELQWEYGELTDLLGPAGYHNGVVVLSVDGNHLGAVDGADGTERWRIEIGEQVDHSPVIVDGTAYVATEVEAPEAQPHDHLGFVSAIAVASGDIQWETGIPAKPNGPPDVVDNTVYVGCEDGNLRAFDASNGDLNWEHDIGGSLTSPAIANGAAYVSSDDEKLYAVAVPQ